LSVARCRLALTQPSKSLVETILGGAKRSVDLAPQDLQPTPTHPGEGLSDGAALRVSTPKQGGGLDFVVGRGYGRRRWLMYPVQAKKCC